jgi:hypothetical protein
MQVQFVVLIRGVIFTLDYYGRSLNGSGLHQQLLSLVSTVWGIDTKGGVYV